MWCPSWTPPGFLRDEQAQRYWCRHPENRWPARYSICRVPWQLSTRTQLAVLSSVLLCCRRFVHLPYQPELRHLALAVWQRVAPLQVTSAAHACRRVDDAERLAFKEHPQPFAVSVWLLPWRVSREPDLAAEDGL